MHFFFFFATSLQNSCVFYTYHTSLAGERKGYPLQYSGLENSLDCIVHGVAKSRAQLSDFHTHIIRGFAKMSTREIISWDVQ